MRGKVADAVADVADEAFELLLTLTASRLILPSWTRPVRHGITVRDTGCPKTFAVQESIIRVSDGQRKVRSVGGGGPIW